MRWQQRGLAAVAAAVAQEWPLFMDLIPTQGSMLHHSPQPHQKWVTGRVQSPD
jgi:hypothetical protein